MLDTYVILILIQMEIEQSKKELKKFEFEALEFMISNSPLLNSKIKIIQRKFAINPIV
jgi:hypothetical protein